MFPAMSMAIGFLMEQRSQDKNKNEPETATDRRNGKTYLEPPVSHESDS